MHAKLRRIDLNQLVTLNALLVEGSVSAAANKVGRSQSAVSHALTQQLARVVEKRSVFDPATSTRAIRIACLDIALPLLAPLLSHVAHAAPKMPIVLVDATSAAEAVRRGDADIGLAFRAPKSTKGLAVVELGQLGWATFGPADHPYVRAPMLDAWLAARRVVVGSDTETEGPVERALARRGLSRTQAMRLPSFTAALTQLGDLDALFASLRAPLEPLAKRLGLQVCVTPLELPSPNAGIVVPRREGAVPEFLMQMVAESFPLQNDPSGSEDMQG